jgi:membrane associated rhomboid family serine protease
VSSQTPAGKPLSARQRRQHELANTSLVGGLKPSSPVGAAVYTLAVLAVLWSIVAIDAMLEHRLLRFGITPREVHGLPGIVFAPFLHVNAAHLAANTVPLAAFLWLLLITGPRNLLIVTATVIVFSGLADWLLGPSDAVIVGASGVVFGWFGYLLARAWFSRSVKWIAIAIIVGAVFSSLFSGLLPSVDHNVFWGGHVTGFLVGIATAAVLHRRPGAKKAKSQPGLAA